MLITFEINSPLYVRNYCEWMESGLGSGPSAPARTTVRRVAGLSEPEVSELASPIRRPQDQTRWLGFEARPRSHHHFEIESRNNDDC